MNQVALLAAAAVLLTHGAVTAQDTTNAGASATMTTASTTMAGQASGQISEKDKMFVQKAASGGMFEVQSSQAATTKGQSDEVKQFAQMMVADHTQANQELMTLAQGKGVTVPQQLNEQHKKMMDRLQGAGADKFDSMYGRMQARAHTEMVALFQNAAQECQDPELKAFAAKTLPKLQQHHEKAKTLPGADQMKAGGKKAGKDGKKADE